MLALAAVLACASAAGPSTAIDSVEVRPNADGYAVDLVFHAPVPRELAFEVLADFDHMADWIPNLRESRVVRREGQRLTIEQKGTAHFGRLSFPFTTVREIELAAPASIHSTQVKGSMKRFESWMSLAAEGAATRLHYHAELTPGAIAATVLSRSFLEHEFAEQFEAVVAEMVRRKAAAARAGQ